MAVEKVELHNAFQWDCDNCGTENFCRAITVEFTPEERIAQAEYTDTEPEDWQTGEWMSRPDEVTCKSCGATFETTEWHQDDKL